MKALQSPLYMSWQPRESLTYPVKLHTLKTAAKRYCELSQISLTYWHTYKLLHSAMSDTSQENDFIFYGKHYVNEVLSFFVGRYYHLFKHERI